MFGTDDVIYVPEGSQLIFDDVYRWRRFKLDVRRFGVRIRPGACDDVAVKIRGALELCRKSPRFAEIVPQISENTEIILRDLAQRSGAVQGSLTARTGELFRNEDAAWWLRISDLPSESYFPEDYECGVESEAAITPFLTYGAVQVAQLDGLLIELPGDEEEGLPFSLDVPRDDGATRWTIPPREPLALVREYCGAHGASAHGRTVNLDTNAVIAEDHQFCTPVGRFGDRLYATLYVSYRVGKQVDVVGKIGDEELVETQKLLDKSHFAMVAEGPTWRIFEREGDIIHLYSGLAGKESEGVETMPHFLLVASASGQYDPQHRGELFEAIMDTIRK